MIILMESIRQSVNLCNNRLDPLKEVSFKLKNQFKLTQFKLSEFTDDFTDDQSVLADFTDVISLTSSQF